MKCNYPLTRIETTDGKVTFEGIYLKDAEVSKNFSQKLQNAKNIKSLKIIPCGQCTSCRLNKAREWANRLMLEAKDYKYNYFLTLTYDDDHIPIKRSLNEETGEVITGTTLNKKDLEKFNHDLRQYWQRQYNHTGIRYYECGEYGSETLRPHYHGIIFNLPNLEQNLILYKVTPMGQKLYTSTILERIWGKGYVVIGEVTYESASYVARYVMKKKYGKDAEKYYKALAKEPEFTTMSRMPGIGKNYYDMNKETIYKTDEIFIHNSNGVISCKPSPYFDRLLEKEDPEKYKQIKRNREKKNILATKNILDAVTVIPNIQRQREIQGRNLEEKIKALKREL